MKILPFLPGEHANLLVLLCYENLSYLSEFEGIQIRKIVRMKREALLCLRFAVGDNYTKSNSADPLQVLFYMAQNVGTDIDNITYRIDQYIAEYMDSKEREYWLRIPKKGESPTPAELLAFLYANYNCDILLLPYGNIY